MRDTGEEERKESEKGNKEYRSMIILEEEENKSYPSDPFKLK